MDHPAAHPFAGRSLHRVAPYGDNAPEDAYAQEPQYQRRRQRLRPPSPKLTLRRILEQRNLLPMHRMPSTAPAAAPGPGALSGVRSPLPSLRIARAARDPSTSISEFPLAQRHSHLTVSSDDGYEYSSNYIPRRPRVPPQQQQHRSQSLSGTASSSTPPVPPARSAPPITRVQSATTGTGHSRRRTMAPEERPKARTCVIDGCSNYIVDNHRCFRHGGGKRCSIDGCNSSAKQLGLCWRHGGSVLCKVEGCNRGVKVKGLCWGHGGGKRKKRRDTGATASSQPSGLPRDSPEPRCIFDDCLSAAVIHSFCDAHSREVVRPGYVFEL